MKKPSMKNFLQEIYNNNKTKSENTMILWVVLCNVRSQCISQEIQVGFEQINCLWNPNIKVCAYQGMISNALFEETNEQHIFSKVFYN